jgi:hypothetical protein
MAANLPGKPGTPTLKVSTETSITIQWQEPADDGGTDISDYQVLWDEGSGGSFVLLGSTLNFNEFTPDVTLTTGLTYRFKVRAVNYIGTGIDSEIAAFISASVPDAPEAPTLYTAT